MKRLTLQLIILLVAICGIAVPTTAAQSADGPAVRAVLFYSPNCPHCHQVINEVLLPMVDEYGGQLQIMGVDTSQAAGSQLYEETFQQFQIPAERRGVPTLVIAVTVLVGSLEIPEQFPALVEEGLAAGGVDWPEIPGLARLLSESTSEPSPTPPPSAIATAGATPGASSSARATSMPAPTYTPDRVVMAVGDDEILSDQSSEPHPDPVAVGLAGLVLAGMAVALVFAAWRLAPWLSWQFVLNLVRSDPRRLARVHTPALPLLCLVGLGVASYLAHVEVNQVEAVCGPVGDCNAVQASAYALFLGVPVAVWGVINYLAVLALWAVQKRAPGRLAGLSLLGLLGLTTLGTLFSVYLTCLELFVIHAVCAWCLSSAVITTILMLLVVIPMTEMKGAPGR